MIDMLKNAKDLIAKGKSLEDPELIQMGMDLLEQYNPDQTSQTIEDSGGFKEVDKPQYVCENCGHTMLVDKEGRKRCPVCKKHQLQIYSPPPQPEPYHQPIHKELTSSRRVVFHNTWNDDMTEGFDEVDKKLKAITKPSPRNNAPVQMVTVTCHSCGKKESVHPIHAPTGETRSMYTCSKCIKNKKGF